jgi:hypothetical protein
LKHECDSETAVWRKECSPKALRNISGVLVADLQNFTQSLMKTHCLILSAIADEMKHEVKKTLM